MGSAVGSAVGTAVGLAVGFAVGCAVGFTVGLAVGFLVGLAVGANEHSGLLHRAGHMNETPGTAQFASV